MITKEEMERIVVIRGATYRRSITQEEINFLRSTKRKAKAINQECFEILKMIKGEAD